MTDDSIKYVQVESCELYHYFAGSDGSLHRLREVKGGIGKQGKGYIIIAMFQKDGTKKYKSLHSVIAEAFLGPRPPNMTINHKDGNKYNNSADNLEYMSARDNVLHAFRLGLRTPRAEHMRKLARENIGKKRTNLRKFSDKQAAQIISLYRAGGKSMKAVAKKFDTSASEVHRIVHGDGIYKEIQR